MNMKVRLVAFFMNNDITYEVKAKIDNTDDKSWVTVRCYAANERQQAIELINDIKMVEMRKYDTPSKFPNTIILEV